jgi:hypothetical protein
MKQRKEPFGRPREYDRDDIQAKLLAWAKKETSINLCGFSAENQIASTKILDWARECPTFRETYNIVRETLGERRERLLTQGLLHTKAYDVNAKHYDRYLKEDSREDLIFENKLKQDLIRFMHDLKNEADQCLSEGLQEQFNALMSQITISQAKKP